MSFFTVKEKPAHRHVGFQMNVEEASDLPNVCSQAMKKLEDQPCLKREGLCCRVLHAKDIVD